MFSKKIYFLAFSTIILLILLFLFYDSSFNELIDDTSSSKPIDSDTQAQYIETYIETKQDILNEQDKNAFDKGQDDKRADDVIDPIGQLIAQMTVEEKVGQLFILGFEGKHLAEADYLKQWINDYKVGNFIVFKRNIESNNQLSDLIAQIDQEAKGDQIPIWVGIDQEGGVVNRLPTKYPSAAQYASWDDMELTYSKHSEMAQELIGLGIDVNFGPVLDINSNPNNPVINTRAFGDRASTVMAHTEAVIASYDDNKLIAVGKHFPGHGDTNDDSHLKLPVITKSWEQLLELEIVPFQHAIHEKIPSMMVGHLLLTAVDEQYPASLSTIIIQEKLINELGFNGIIMTDDLVMEGILDHYTIAEAAILALKAGVHMLIIGHQPDLQVDAIEAVKNAVANGEISKQLLDEKVYKILSYKLKEGL